MTPDHLIARIIEIHALMRHVDPTGKEAGLAFAQLGQETCYVFDDDDLVHDVRDAYIAEHTGMEDGYAVEEMMDLARARDRAWTRLSEAVRSNDTNGEGQ